MRLPTAECSLNRKRIIYLHTRYRIVFDINVDQRFLSAPPFLFTIQILVIFEQCFPVDFWKVLETYAIIWFSFENFWIQNGGYIHFQIIYQTICWNCLKTQPLPVFRVESSYKLVDSLFPNRWNTSQSFYFFGLYKKVFDYSYLNNVYYIFWEGHKNLKNSSISFEVT